MAEIQNRFTHAEGEIVGSYRLGHRLTLVDQAGFEAERIDYPRTVTIRFTEEVDGPARFDLDHPHLARVLEQGFTITGAPYHVLEAVTGEPLDTYCNSHKLGLDERLELISQVIEAAAYAHQHLALHRDLSCSCTLVTGGDAKVLGFGNVAALTGPSIDGDIRSIGRMLMQLLCGTSTVEVRLGETPMRSALISLSTSDQLRVAQARGLSVAQLRKKLNADLEGIVSKALRTGDKDGYEACAALGEDLRHYLQGYPVSATSAGRFEAAYTWSRRHPAPVVAVLLLLFCLLSGGVIVLRSTAHARLEEHATNERLAELVRLTGSLDARFYQALGSQPNELKMQMLLLDQLRQTLDEATKDLPPGDRANCQLAAQYLSISKLDAAAGRKSYAESEIAVAQRLQKVASCAN
jgi:hypothetical protein